MLTPVLSRRAAFAALTVPAADALTGTALAAPLRIAHFAMSAS